MTTDASDPAADSDARDPAESAVADRTAAAVFASLAADGPSVDTDAVLDGTSPEEIIDRTDEPAPASSVHSSLIDEAELTELILPDRRSDDSFLWVETTDSGRQPVDDAETSSTFETYFETGGSEPPRTDAPDSATAMTDSPETRPADESGPTNTDDATGFETDSSSAGGRVPTHTPSPSTTPGPGESTGQSDRSRSDRSTGATSTPADRSPSDSGESATPSATAAERKSEIRTTVQYFDSRKADRSPDGLLASAKALLSRLFRPGRSG